MPNNNIDQMYMNIATEISNMSYCKRRQVGSVIIKDKSIISYGYNGMPTGFENICECEDGKSKPEVLHAETNALTKITKSTQSSIDADLYVTLSPCLNCSKLIVQSGIKRVFFY